VKLVTSWWEMPAQLRIHLNDRLDRIPNFESDLMKLAFWMKSSPDVPEGEWFKDFQTFIVCGEGQFIKTFLDGDMVPRGTEVF